MDLEREKGVTIKASAVRMYYTAKDNQKYEINLIDTPGHVDFGYEVSRALKACEGAVLVVDATQGIEAQTLANLYQALDADLTIIPVINKIDLPSARPDEVAEDVGSLLGIDPLDVIQVSAKEGINVDQILEAIVTRVPPPKDADDVPSARADLRFALRSLQRRDRLRPRHGRLAQIHRYPAHVRHQSGHASGGDRHLRARA